MKRLVTICAIFFIVACSANSAMADTWTESGDAGELTLTAQVVSGSGPLDFITGGYEGSNADMYQIYISAPAIFSADTSGSAGDTQLFLFDASGMGVYANDDLSVGNSYSLLPSGDDNSPTTPGIYYLAVTDYGYDPYSTGGLIFPEWRYEDVHGPTEAGGGSSIASWGGAGNAESYSIELTGTQLVVPAPGAILLGILGLSVVGVKLRKFA